MRSHDFVLGDRVDEPMDPQWHRVHAKCSRCGEERQVFHAVPMRMLNVGPCERRGWLSRLLGGR